MVKLLIVLLTSIFIAVVAGYFYLREEKPQDKRKKVEINEEKFIPLKEIKEITSEEMEYLTRYFYDKGGYYDEDADEIIAFGIV